MSAGACPSKVYLSQRLEMHNTNATSVGLYADGSEDIRPKADS